MPAMIDKPAAGRSVVLAFAAADGGGIPGLPGDRRRMPVLPLHVYDSLGFGPTMVGSVAGFQFAAALLAGI